MVAREALGYLTRWGMKYRHGPHVREYPIRSYRHAQGEQSEVDCVVALLPCGVINTVECVDCCGACNPYHVKALCALPMLVAAMVAEAVWLPLCYPTAYCCYGRWPTVDQVHAKNRRWSECTAAHVWEAPSDANP
jgi:hypothetical protein